ncbi:MAG: 5'/3'-nucleotidase SurE [Prevotella sp.]|nr:5'/3'-nucleotidase SurE [Prevotella sp.]
MKNKRPLILISNDDGYRARGIRCLVEMVKDFGDVIVCAPNSGRSGSSCAFTVTDSLRLIKRGEEPGVEVWSCTGTPVDCVKIALAELCPRKPDLVIGGINHGDNASVNTHYSGTMGVTMEGCMKYIPSIAFSVCDHRAEADFEPLRPYVREIVDRVLAEGLPRGICLNVNFPVVEKYAGVRVCRMAFGTWGNEIDKRHHPRGHDYYWMVGEYTNDEPEAEDTDNWALTHGYVAITPTTMDVTAYEVIEEMKKKYEER